MTTQGATFNMHGQLYRKHTNVMALLSSPVVSALGSESNNLRVKPPSRTTNLSWSRQGVVCLKLAGKKMQAPLLTLAKSIYHF